MLSKKFYDGLAKQMNSDWEHQDRKAIIERVSHFIHCEDKDFDETRFKKKAHISKE